jgi:hypothetical protein
VACLLLLFFKPVLLELGSAARSNGANYTYLLQFSSKALALVGAAATLLDAMATSTVSAATATAYLSGEFSNLPIPQAVLAILLLAVITSVSFFNSKDSTSITLSITVIHVSDDLISFDLYSMYHIALHYALVDDCLSNSLGPYGF